ncbi:MAG: glycosyltransferase [Firmicutes bacterium]|nr:glycosyltransferase [Bacillota bacterium]
MNIAFDATAILGPMSKNRGIGNYALSQFKAMIENDNNNKYFFFNMFEAFSMSEIVNSENIEDIYLFSGIKYELISDIEYKDIVGDIIKNFIKDKKIDVFYITSPFESQIIRYEKKWFNGIRVIATVYDIIPFVMKDIYLRDKSTYEYYISCIEMLRWMDEYLVISESVKTDMIKYLNFPEEKIHVIYGAVDADAYKEIKISDLEKQELFNKYKIDSDYIMCTGGDDHRKNIEGLIKAYAMLDKDIIHNYQLVVVCKLSEISYEKYTSLIKKLNITGRVILTNFVTNVDMIKLYNLATLMAFPSLYEGLGLPILEAWSCGIPVLTSNNSSLDEIGKDAAILVDPYDVKDISKGLKYALTEADLDELIRKGKEKLKLFNWSGVAEKAINIINNISPNIDVDTDKDSVNKIAMFTPLPPIQSGISDYSVDIITQLSNKFDIDVFIDDYKANCELPENVQIFNHKKFKKKYSEYDRIIYQVGNSLYHQYMFDYIKKYKGIIVLHDYRLNNVLEAMYLYKDYKPKIFKRNLAEDLNENEIDDYMNNVSNGLKNELSINGFVTNYADRIIVHSEYAKRELLRKKINYSVNIIPLYAKINVNATDILYSEKLNINNTTIVFSSFGHIHETKRTIPILKAFKKLEEHHKEIKLFFVGKMAEELSEQFYKCINENNLDSKVIVTGYIDLNDFENYIDISDICLNLRYPYNGESSASFMRLLGKGKCTIVNKIGSFSEIPENACVMIDSVEDMDPETEVEQIYNAMIKCMDKEYRKRVEENAYKFAKETLEISKVCKKYEEVIKMKKNASVALNEIRLKSYVEKYMKSKVYTKFDKKLASKTFSYSIIDI